MKKTIYSLFKRAAIAVIIAFFATSAFAEKSDAKTEVKTDAAVLSVSGNVVDEISGEALVGVEVKVEGSDKKAYTDFDGHFEIDNLKAGDCKIVASYISYDKNEKILKLESKNKPIKIGLQTSK